MLRLSVTSVTSDNFECGSPVVGTHAFVHGFLVDALYIGLARHVYAALLCQIHTDVHVLRRVGQGECGGVVLRRQLLVLGVQIEVLTAAVGDGRGIVGDGDAVFLCQSQCLVDTVLNLGYQSVVTAYDSV